MEKCFKNGLQLELKCKEAWFRYAWGYELVFFFSYMFLRKVTSSFFLCPCAVYFMGVMGMCF